LSRGAAAGTLAEQFKEAVAVLRISGEPSRFCDGLSRRDWLRIGGLSCVGLSLPTLFRATAARAATPLPITQGRAKSCMIVFLSGGPPQHETFDPKPDASEEIRGQFAAVRTSAPGIYFSELLPQIGRLAHRMTVIRSMTTGVNQHSVSGSYMMTGYRHPNVAESAASDKDWPSIGAVVAKMRPSDKSPFSAVTIPERVVNNPGVPWPGQNGGFMGAPWDPHLFTCDPTAEHFRIDSLRLPDDVTPLRMSSRESLLTQLDAHLQRLPDSALAGYDTARHQALDAIRNGTTRDAFNLDEEQPATRDRYGRHKFGQSLLLGRRLVESGVRLVQVNFPREPNDLSIGNPLWDTHSNNAERVKTALCPPFDQGFSALLEDMEQRGLLDETLVIAMGEFGRSPKHNPQGGRDHWGACFSIAVAGAGVPAGQVVGATDKIGGAVESRAVRPEDLSATIFHKLGIDPAGDFHDRLNRPMGLTTGTPIRELL
jgi:hypothetical protein